MTKEEIYNFLKLNGFKLEQQDTSEYFNDYFDVFANDVFAVRFSSTKSFETVDIRNIKDEENWYDLALIKALLFNEVELNQVTTIQTHIGFLRQEFHRIGELFDRQHYPNTKIRLDELGNKRAKQMFPSQF
ncbi:hypothetical protein QF042_003733 [Pedobacter sp. W3I1]|uniref:hypothetical protein n=1 Tax=Pedobacter sp. W3I1 TaxID=3042291 RepID=UPI0027879CDA|nr:hypothetical protein [Pedobacter sp. W3I1]MDQ0640168.1 hypothetical protein [Pedobacter sp. W3I1]